MQGMLLIEWVLNISNSAVMFGAELLFQSTIIIALGLFTAFILKEKGAVVQSLVLRIFLIAVLISPILSLCFNIASVKIIKFNIPPASLNRTEENNSSAQNNYTIFSSIPEVEPHNHLRENTVSAEKENADGISHIEKGVHSFPNSVEEINVSAQFRNNPLLSTEENEIYNEFVNIEKKPEEVVLPTGINIQGMKTEFNNKSPTLWKNKRTVFYLIFTFVWATFSLFLFLRFILHNIFIQQIRHNSFEAKPSFIKTCKALADKLGIKPPKVLQSNSVKSPFLSGLFNPFILLPLGEHESSLLKKEIFLHELSHIERRDYLWNLLSQIGIVIFPLQPLIWILSNWIEVTSDYVCDDFVMKYSSNHRSYAANLFRIAQCYQQADYKIKASVGILTFKSPLKWRIERILDSSHTLSVKMNAMFVLYISFICICITVVTGFIGFEEKDTFKRINSSVTLSGTTIIDRLFETSISKIFCSNSPDSASILENLRVNQAANIGFTSAVKNKNEENETESDRKDANINLTETSLSYYSDSDELSANPMADDFELSAEAVSTVVNNIEKAGDDTKDSESIASPGKKTYDEIHLKGSSIPEERSENPSVASASNQNVNSSIEVVDEKSKIQTDETNVITNQNSNTLAFSVFATDNAGIQLTGFRENRIKMPVNKNVNVIVDFDYENYDFDLRNEKERRQYSIYYGLDKLKNEPAWSPDGRWIAFTDRSRIWIVSTKGGEPKLIFENLIDGFSVGRFRSLCFTKDSQEITFKKDVYDINRGSTFEIINNDDESSRYAYFCNPIPNIESVNIYTGEHRVIVEEGYNFCWSNCGRYLCFLNWGSQVNSDGVRIGQHGLPTIYDTITGKKQLLSDDNEKKYGKPTFSPDGTHIIIPVREEFGTTELYRIFIDGSKTEQLTSYNENVGHGKYLDFPEYSPDGKWILYTDFTLTEDQPLKRLFLYSTLTREQFEYFQNPKARNSLGKWSPDGTKICYVTQEDDANYIYICDFFPDNYKLQKPFLKDDAAPLSFKLYANYPNPFNTVTTIEFSIPEAEYVSLAIYNIMGQKVRELVSGHTEPGSHSVVWNGCDENGVQVASGIYISQLQMGKKYITGKMTMVK